VHPRVNLALHLEQRLRQLLHLPAPAKPRRAQRRPGAMLPCCHAAMLPGGAPRAGRRGRWESGTNISLDAKAAARDSAEATCARDRGRIGGSGCGVLAVRWGAAGAGCEARAPGDLRAQRLERALQRVDALGLPCRAVHVARQCVLPRDGNARLGHRQPARGRTRGTRCPRAPGSPWLHPRA